MHFQVRITREPSRIVLAHGCFDPLHYGHLMHLQEARTLGDVLIVGVTADEFVNKGPERPVFNLTQRVSMLRALAIVDHVIPVYAPGPEALIAQIKPQVYVKGREYLNKLPEEGLVRQYGGKVHYTFDEIASEIKATKILRFYAETKTKKPS